MKASARGFSLIELITVMILLGIVSVVLFSRLGPVNTAAVQSGRDDIIAALFFAQQTAMMRSTGGNIQLVLSGNSVSVNEAGEPIAVSSEHYPLSLPRGVQVADATFTFDKLGRTSPASITLTGTGSNAGTSASIRVEPSGYAYAQ